MLQKTLGFMVSALGALGTALSAYGFTRARTMADLAESAANERATWIFHWQFTTVQYGCISLMLLAGGILILARRSAGVLVAAVAILLAGLSSWIARAIGFSRYPFEAPNTVETIILIGLSGFLLLLYLRRALWE